MNCLPNRIPSCWTAAWAPCCRRRPEAGRHAGGAEHHRPGAHRGHPRKIRRSGQPHHQRQHLRRVGTQAGGQCYTLEEIIAAGIANCKRACAPYGALAALDVGPLGELLEPNGTLAFEDAMTEYGRIVRPAWQPGLTSSF